MFSTVIITSLSKNEKSVGPGQEGENPDKLRSIRLPAFKLESKHRQECRGTVAPIFPTTKFVQEVRNLLLFLIL